MSVSCFKIKSSNGKDEGRKILPIFILIWKLLSSEFCNRLSRDRLHPHCYADVHLCTVHLANNLKQTAGKDPLTIWMQSIHTCLSLVCVSVCVCARNHVSIISAIPLHTLTEFWPRDRLNAFHKCSY